MPTENIVNRISNKEFIDSQNAKLTPVVDGTVATTPAPNSPSINSDGVDIYKFSQVDSTTVSALKEGMGEIVKALPVVDEIADNPDVQETLKSGGLETNEVILNSLRALVGGSDFKVFRAQVIRAFKHSGCDTVKFFGE